MSRKPSGRSFGQISGAALAPQSSQQPSNTPHNQNTSPHDIANHTLSKKRPYALLLPLRLALRELRGGLKGFKIFIACLFLGVAAIGAIGSLNAAITEAMAGESRALLGGDLEISRSQIPLERLPLERFRQMGQLSTSARLRTMAHSIDAHKHTPAALPADTEKAQTAASVSDTATRDALLVELRAVDNLYPLFGDFIHQPRLDHKALFTPQNNLWGLAADPLILSRMGLKLGDHLKLGAITGEIRAVIQKEPDKANLGFQLGPSLFIAHEALAASGLVTTGSLIDYSYKIALNPDLEATAVREQLKTDYPDATWRVRDHKNAAPGLRRTLEQMASFLIIIGLSSLIMGGIGVMSAVKGYMERKKNTIAILKILGAENRLIFQIYLIQILLIAGFATALGLITGALLPLLAEPFLPAVVPVRITVSLYMLPLVTAGLYGLLIAFTFTLWPLAEAHQRKAAHIFRDLGAAEAPKRPPSWTLGAIAIAFGLLVGLAILFAKNPWVAGGFLGGFLVILLLLKSFAYLVENISKVFFRPKNTFLRLAIVNIYRRGNPTQSIVTALGLGLTIFAALSLIEGNLTAQFTGNGKLDAPAFFMVDIQENQKEDLAKTISMIDGASDLKLVPSLRGSIVKINDIPAKEWPIPDSNYRWVLSGDRGLTYGKDPGGKGSQLTSGNWWPDDYQGPPQISFGKLEAEGLGLKMGDAITVNILGRNITATIASLREINWGTFGFNFVVIFDPHSLKSAPHSYTATVKASGSAGSAAEEAIFRQVSHHFPNITLVRMKDVMNTVNRMIAQITSAIKATALIAIVAGILVLSGAIASGFSARVYDSTILKVLGAQKWQILWAYGLEYMILGVLTGGLALVFGLSASYILLHYIFELDFIFLPAPVLGVLFFGLITIMFLGLFHSLRALQVKPAEILRNE